MIKKIGIGLNIWNGEKTIINTLKSLINQTYYNIEIIILDNRSTDQTAQKIKNFIKRNKKKKKKIKIELIIDKKKRNIPDSQKFLLQKYLYKFEYSMIANDDDIYKKKYIETLYDKIKKSKVSMVYAFKKKIDINGKIYDLKNYPTYGKNDSYFVNTLKFLIYREHYKISFGIYKTKNYLKLMKYSSVYDESRVNWDNVSMIYFLLNYKIDFTSKKLFYFFEKDRSKTFQIRNNVVNVNFFSIFNIFLYQFNFSKKVSDIIFKSKKINFFFKLILVIILILSSVQKSFSYTLRSLISFISKSLKNT